MNKIVSEQCLGGGQQRVSIAWIVLVLIMMTVTGTSGQNKAKLDSLIDMLPGKQGAERIDLLFDIVTEHILLTEHAIAIEKADATMREAFKQGDSIRIARMGLLKASALRRSEKLQEAAEVYHWIVPLVKRHGSQREIAIALASYSAALQNMAEYSKAMVYLQESVWIRKELLGEERFLYVSYNNIGVIYYTLQYYTKALEYYILCEELTERFAISVDRDVLFNNIALCYGFLGDYDKAKQYNKKSIDVCGETCSIKALVHNHFAEGLIHLGQGDSVIAAQEFEKSHDLAVKAEDYRYQSENMLYLGALANGRKDFTEALRYLREGERCTVIGRYRKLLYEIHQEKALAYRGLKEYNQEFVSRERYIQYRDSVFGEDMVNALLATQVDSEQARNKAILAVSETSVARHDRQQRLMQITGILLLFVVSIFLWDIRSRRRENKDLEQEVGRRTRELAEKVLASERNTVERGSWESKITQTMNGGMASLEGLGALITTTPFGKRILAKMMILQDRMK